MKKKVLMPIEVPEGDYCWKFTGGKVLCKYFDNEGGHPKCDLFHIPWKSADGAGILKPGTCKSLKEQE